MCYLKIEREFGNPDEINFSFRFFDQNLKNKTIIENELIENHIKFELFYTEIHQYVIIINLNVHNKAQLIGLIRQIIEKLNIDKESFGVYASIISYYDHSGISFPREICELIRDVGGNIDISIINIFKDENEDLE